MLLDRSTRSWRGEGALLYFNQSTWSSEGSRLKKDGIHLAICKNLFDLSKDRIEVKSSQISPNERTGSVSSFVTMNSPGGIPGASTLKEQKKSLVHW